MIETEQKTFGETKIEDYGGRHICDANMVQDNGEIDPCTYEASIVIRNSSRSYYYCKMHARNQWLADAR